MRPGPPDGAAARVRAFYDHWSPLFLDAAGDTFQSGLVRPAADAWTDADVSTRLCAEAAGLRDGDDVLDAGCGVGGPAAALGRLYPRCRVEGVTLSPVQVALGTARLAAAGLGDRVRLRVADYHALPFPDASFDAVFFFECTGYSPDPRALYREAARVLRPGGRVYVKDVFRARPDAADDDAMSTFDALWACTRTGTLDEAAHAARAAGLDVATRVYPHVDTTRFVVSMLAADGGLNAFGRGFARTRAPVVFGELVGVR